MFLLVSISSAKCETRSSANGEYRGAMEICEGWKRNELEVKERKKKNLLEKSSKFAKRY